MHSHQPARGLLRILLLLCLALLGSRAAAADGLDVLFAQDRRLAIVAEQLLGGNAALCPAQMPRIGMILHSRDQYHGDWAKPLFTQGDLAIAQILPGSVAENAGLRPNDGLLTIAGHRPVASAGTTLREAALTLLASQWRADTPLLLEMMRDGARLSVELAPLPTCHAIVEIGTDGGMAARTDGHIVRVPLDLAKAASGDDLAVIVAHELAHIILYHRVRLEAAGADKGLLGEFGQNRRLLRQAEEEADRLSVHLLANAGFDPASAPAFWHSRLGRRVGGGLLRHRAYPPPRQRAELLEHEIATYLDGTAPFHEAEHLIGSRNRPLDDAD